MNVKVRIVSRFRVFWTETAICSTGDIQPNVIAHPPRRGNETR